MNSPLYHRIDSTLTLQSLNKSEYEADEAQLRGAAMSAGIPLEQLREAYRIFRETQAPQAPPPRPSGPAGQPVPPDEPFEFAEPMGRPTVAGPSLKRAAAQASETADEQLRAAQARMAEAQRDVERNRATAASVAQELNASQTPTQQMSERLRAAAATAEQHSRAHQIPVDFAEWTINHEDEIKS